MYPEELFYLGLFALGWILLNIIAKIWLNREYRKDPDVLIAEIERNRRQMEENDN